MGEQSYKDSIDIIPQTLYEQVEGMGQLPKTAAPSPEDYFEVYKEWMDKGYDILYIGLSSEISSSIQNALIAAQSFDKQRIEVVDSLNLSSGIGIQVLKATDYRREGLSLQQMADKIRRTATKVRTAFIIDTLEYLYMGGRCSALSSFVGSILHIRPVVTVKDGKIILREKFRGKREKALNALLQGVIQDKKLIDKARIIITHALSSQDALYLKEKLQEEMLVDEIIITEAGCVISSHCGPNTVGIIYMNK
jgi:DegV family protein with EDD domain